MGMTPILSNAPQKRKPPTRGRPVEKERIRNWGLYCALDGECKSGASLASERLGLSASIDLGLFRLPLAASRKSGSR